MTRGRLCKLQRDSETSVARRREAARGEQAIAEKRNGMSHVSVAVAFSRQSPALRADRLRRSVVRPSETVLSVSESLRSIRRLSVASAISVGLGTPRPV